MTRFKEYRQEQMMLMPASLEEKVAPGHLARYVSRAIDEIDLRDIEDSYSELGRHAYHPRMLIKIIVYGYSIGVRSSRRLEKELKEDIVFMWLSGGQEPDFRTISDFRKDRLRDIKKIFSEVLQVCAELGMVRCGKISIDGTKIEANSGKNKITFRKKLEKSLSGYEEKIEEILKEAEAVDAEEDRLYGNTDGYSVEPHTPEEIRKALKHLRQKKARLEKEQGKLQVKSEVVKEKLNRLGEGRNSYGNTDPDATLMLMKNGSLGVGYNVQMATENQVIIAYGVYQRPNDNHLLQPMIEEIEKNLGSQPEVVTADKGYCSQSNYEFLVNRNIKAAIPPNTYDYDMAARHKGKYRYSKNEAYEKLKVGMLDFLATETGKGLMKRRKHDIEPTFGDIKHNMGFRKFQLRRLPKAAIEVGIIAIAHNLKKVKSWLESPQFGPVAS